MSLAKLLDHLQTGDVIIVRGGDASLRSRLPATLQVRSDAVDGSTINPRQLLRNLITVRKDGGKK